MFIKINHVQYLVIFICKFKLFNTVFYKVFCSAIYLLNGVDKCLNKRYKTDRCDFHFKHGNTRKRSVCRKRVHSVKLFKLIITL